MKPILFPYTYVSESLAEILAVFFDKIVVYQPIQGDLPLEMQALKQRGFIEIRTPAHGDDRDIKAVIQDYQNWAQLHQGRFGLKISLLKALDPKVPLFDDSAPARVLADLKTGPQTKAGQGEEDPLLRARLFLHFAQLYDRCTREIEADLGQHEARVQNLINALKAEKDLRVDESHKTGVKQQGAPDDLMLPERLSAWTQMLLHDSKKSALFVTPNPAIFEYVKNISADAEVIFHSDAISDMKDPKAKGRSLQQSLIAHLNALSENYSPVAIEELGDLFAHERDSQAAAITICRVPGLSPQVFFEYAGNSRAAAPEIAQQTPGNKNNLIILVFSGKKH